MNITDHSRYNWLIERRRMEALLVRQRRSTLAGERTFPSNGYLENCIAAALHLTGLYKRGHRNAGDFRLEQIFMDFPNLPEAFDGYTILHLSDFHVDNVSSILDRAALLLRGLAVDLVVMSGDYQTRGTPAATKVSAMIEPLLAGLIVRNCIVAVLGNHDRHEMAGALDGLGIKTLINEGIAIERGTSKLMVVGTDDVNCFYTESAPAALRSYSDYFRIAVVHTPDLASVAAEAGYSLYLTGHTHGGQMCTHGGRPVITGLDSHHELASGYWEWNGMLGHTSRGLGTAMLPVRFNCPPEATVIRLGCRAP